MNKLTLFSALSGLLLALTAQPATAHGGDDHGAGEAPGGNGMTYFTSQAVSDKYELVLHYEPLEAGEGGKMRLYINEFDSNKPVVGATLQLSSPEDDKLKLTVKPIGAGIYELSGTFPAKKTYSLTVSLNAGPGADLMLLAGIEIGKELPVAAVTASAVASTAWYQHPFVLLGVGLLLGMALMFGLLRLRNRRVAAAVAVLLGILPTANWQPATAHGGDDHSGAATAVRRSGGGGGTSSTFSIPKETQFLFGILTQRLAAGEQARTTTVAGTVIPSSAGQAVVQSPQVGRLISLAVRVGQLVTRGQTLAVVEQSIDAATQVNLQSERNNLLAEVQVARQEYDRLKTIADIIAKRDLTEAESRLNRAQANLKVFTNITQTGAQGGRGTARSISLRAPVSGIVGPFAYAIGSTVNVGETLFTITNLGKIYIEAQVFEKDLAVLRSAKSFEVTGVNDAGKSGVARLLSQAQTINASNQSQRLLFEMDNAGGAFKIGEFVTIRVQSATSTRGLSVPNSAISELNGKPVVFIKDAPEVVSVAYVTTGADNGSRTQILTGAEADERVIVSGTYQAKMIYLNQ